MNSDAKAPPPDRGRAALTRRSLFALAGSSAALAAAPGFAQPLASGFTHSVASGEPGPASVLLWARFVGTQEIPLVWQVSETSDFSGIVAEGETPASPQRDWCAKAIAQGLSPGRWYYYRFLAPGGAVSDTGRTRTLPEGSTTRFAMAVFSCANLGFGWFNAYAHAAEADEFDLAVHLGDYIYEYGAGTYPSAEERHRQSVLLPPGETVALADYRLRYATYRADPDLVRLHQLLPMIAMWDDHESANDSWEGGAENHQSATEGEWSARKAAAKRAWREWMPVSDVPYAAYEIGDLATLFRLDTRLEGRARQFSLADVLGEAGSAEQAARALTAFRDGDWADPARQLLGADQEAWLARGLAASKASGTRWQVVAQQVLMGRLRTPPGILEAIGDAVPGWVRQQFVAAAMASATGLPANMDAWDGYPAARSRVLRSALEADANLVVLAGDTHNGWAFELAHEQARAGIEFGTPGVTSPGLERSVSAIDPDRFARDLVAANEQLVWADTARRGYTMIELTRDRVSAQFRFVANVRERSTALSGTKRITSRARSHRLRL